MPIRPEMRGLYPANWKSIRAAILSRAGNRCEWCKKPNTTDVLAVRGTGEWYEADWHRWLDERGRTASVPEGAPVYTLRVVLTIAHLDHDPSHNDESNLRALCQRCHLRYDAREHAKNAARTRAQKSA